MLTTLTLCAVLMSGPNIVDYGCEEFVGDSRNKDCHVAAEEMKARAEEHFSSTIKPLMEKDGFEDVTLELSHACKVAPSNEF